MGIIVVKVENAIFPRIPALENIRNHVKLFTTGTFQVFLIQLDFYIIFMYGKLPHLEVLTIML